MTLCTVHVWGATGVMVMFYLGAGSWLLAVPAAAVPAPEPARRRPGHPRAVAPEPAGVPAGTARAGAEPRRRPGRGPAPATLARRRDAYGARRP
jgi:hypothetical protein